MTFWFVHIFLIGFLSYLAFKHLKSSFSPLIYWSALSLKLTAGIVLGLIFHYHYGSGDTLMFFEKAKKMSSLGIIDHFDELISDGSYRTNNHPRTLFFIKILSVFSLLTGNSYWITSLYLSLIGFISSWFFVITICRLFPHISTASTISFLYIPSVVFWSSGIMKDTLSSAALIFLVAILLKVVRLKKTSMIEAIIGLLSLLTLLKIKHYLFITFILFAALVSVFQLVKSLKNRFKWIYALIIITLAIASTQLIHPYLKWDRLPQTFYENNLAILENSLPNSQSSVIIETPSWEAIIQSAPKAFFTGLFRPSLSDTITSFGWVHKLENFILLILSILSILIWMKEKQRIDLALLIPAIACICLLATMFALTTPNFGTLVRYKNAFMPFLFWIVSVLPYEYLNTVRGDHAQKNLQ